MTDSVSRTPHWSWDRREAIGAVGARVPDDQFLIGTRALGDYGRVWLRGAKRWRWYVKLPNGAVGALDSHRVMEHEDGRISVDPAIVAPGPQPWHGYLVRGAFKEIHA